MFGVLMCMLLGMGFVACNDDDEEQNTTNSSVSANPIVGTWKFTWDGGYEQITFYSDGTGREEYLDKYDHEIYEFRYTFDASTGNCVISYADGDTNTGIITFIASNKISIGGEEYVKI